MDIWRSRRAELEIMGTEIRNRIKTLEKRTSEKELGKEVLDNTYEELVMDFNDENGGFDHAPIFPRPHMLFFLLRYWKRKGEKNALSMVEKTLQQMRLGGIFDQVGFGFHRFSTDGKWLVPHFEKMFYDQALLTLSYTEAYQATGAGNFILTAKDTIDYVLRDLAAPRGGFYSTEDADTEGEEGKFYIWTQQEIREAVQPEDMNLTTLLFGVKVEGNYYDPSTQNRNGNNILHFPKPIKEIALESNLAIEELIIRLGRIRNALFEKRKQRLPTEKDDKILTDWNGLMIAALAKAGQTFGEQRHLQLAAITADFILNHMRTKNGLLYHRYAKGEKAVEGFLDDYAFLTFGLIELYEGTFEKKYLQTAKTLTNIMIEKFWDEKTGGFFFWRKS